MLTLYVYKNDIFQAYPDISAISDFIREPNAIVWLDALNPNDDEMRLLSDEFGFHPLAIEDYYTPHFRPKVNEFDGYCFIITHVIQSIENESIVTADELDMFVGKNYIVTLHEKPFDVLDEVSALWKKSPRMLKGGVGLLLYDIMDAVVDSYFPILDRIEEELDEIEDTIFSGQVNQSSEQIFKLKRKLLIMHRVAAPLRDVFNSITRRDQEIFTEQATTYLRDIYDHTLRIVDTIDTYRDMLTSALDAYFTVISNQMNSIMKTLTVAATILMTIQIITGIYGMNLQIPETHWKYGYPFALGLMAALAGGLLYYFKRIKWL